MRASAPVLTCSGFSVLCRGSSENSRGETDEQTYAMKQELQSGHQSDDASLKEKKYTSVKKNAREMSENTECKKTKQKNNRFLFPLSLVSKYVTRLTPEQKKYFYFL